MGITEQKIKLLAKFFDKERHDDDPHIEQLWALDSIWIESYNNCVKSKIGPYKATITANEIVIAHVLTEKTG